MPNQILYSRRSKKYSTKGVLSIPLFVHVMMKRFSVGDSYCIKAAFAELWLSIVRH